MADSLELSPTASIPLDMVEIRTSRSSGPGGQHANVTASRVEAVVDLEGLAGVEGLSESQLARLIATLGPRVSATAQDTRSQLRNRELALQRLADKLSAALVTAPPRRPSRPTRASIQRRLEGKRRQSTRKQDRRRPAGED